MIGKMTRLVGRALLVASAMVLAACSGTRDAGGAPDPITVTVLPAVISLELEAQYQFTANVTGGQQGGQGVTWTVIDGAQYGSISGTGLYSAPITMPPTTNAIIEARSVADPNVFSRANIQLLVAPDWGELPVTITVGNREMWQATEAPATFGVPLKKGVIFSTNSLRLIRGFGTQAVPAQFEITSRWPDGSVRWLLVDVIADLSSTTSERDYVLDTGGTGNATGTGLSVTDSGSNLTVLTGPLEFTLSKTGFRLFESVRIDRTGNGQVNDEVLRVNDLRGVVASDGLNDFRMDISAPTRIQVEQSGPIRVTIVAEGTHEDTLNNVSLHYICRITAWAGLPDVKIQYSFLNREGDGEPTSTPTQAAAQLAAVQSFESLYMDLPIDLEGQPPVAAFGGLGVSHNISNIPAGQFAGLSQGYQGTHDANDPGNPQPPGYSGGIGSAETLENVWPTENRGAIAYTGLGVATFTGARAPGWVQVHGGNVRVTANVRDFWQMYPKSLEVTDIGDLRVGIWPENAWPMQVFAGVMRTHEVLYTFARGTGTSTAEAGLRHLILNDPPVGVIPPRHVQASLAVGPIGATDGVLLNVQRFQPGSQQFVSSYMAQVISHMGNLLVDRNEGNGAAVGHEFGFWAFGTGKSDIPDIGWENHRWGIARACLMWHLASGNRPLRQFGDEAARHFRDVSVLHADIGWRYDYTESNNPAVSNGKASQLGRVRPGQSNKQFHLGRYDDGETGLEYLSGEFLAEHYLLTGDRLSLDVLRKIFRHVQGSWKRHFDASNSGDDMTMTAPSVWLSNALLVTSAYFMAGGLNDAAAATMNNFVMGRVNTRQTTPKMSYDPNGAGFGTVSGTFRAWEMGHMAEALEYARWVRDDLNIDARILLLMNWLYGTNASVYLGNGEFAEVPGGTVDYGGPNLMIGAGIVGAIRAGGTGWTNRTNNLLNTQTTKIRSSSLPDNEIRHSQYARFFRAGPLTIGAVSQ
jgi:hypothetical protein